jgi:UDP-glucose 4-epimerase
VGTSVLRLAQILKEASRSDVAIEHAPRRPGEMQHSVLNVEKAREVLGWVARVSIEDGLARSLAWFAERHGTVARA